MEIPIIVTKRTSYGKHFSFKMVCKPHLQAEVYAFTTRKPQRTLESVSLARTRRISSSGTSKRFPKDFFQNDCQRFPLKLAQPPPSHELPNIPGRVQLDERDSVETPKFNQRHKEQSQGKTRIEEYLSHRRQVLFQKRMTPQSEHADRHSQWQYDPIENSCKQSSQEPSNQKQYGSSQVQPSQASALAENPNLKQELNEFELNPGLLSTFNMTLGKKISLKQPENDRQQEKENCAGEARVKPPHKLSKHDVFRIRRNIG